LSTNFVQTCGYCGSVSDVEVGMAIGYKDTAEYNCPECRKRFIVKSSSSPKVTLVSGRTDGRNEMYPNS